MNHLTEDELLNILLFPEEAEFSILNEHLGKCPLCQSHMDEIQKDISELSSVPFSGHPPKMKMPRTGLFRLTGTAGLAAVFLAFLAIGFWSADLHRHRNQTIVVQPQKFRPAVQPLQGGRFFICENIDIPDRF